MDCGIPMHSLFTIMGVKLHNMKLMMLSQGYHEQQSCNMILLKQVYPKWVAARMLVGTNDNHS